MAALGRLLFGALLAASLVSPALAHRLKLFATVEEGAVTGYAFFIGGGRARGAEIVFRDARGGELHRLAADDEGVFRWRPAQPTDLTVTVNSGDGHVAEAHIAAERFGASVPGVEPAPAVAQAAPAASQRPQERRLSPAELAEIERRIEDAVARQVRPLMEAYAQAEGRVRFNDVMGGVGMLVGLAGVALWASQRRRIASDSRDKSE